MDTTIIRIDARNDTRQLLKECKPIVSALKDDSSTNRVDTLHYIVKEFYRKHSELKAVDGNTEGLGAA